MPLVSIQAYFYSQEEEDLIRQYVSDLEETDSFLLGSIEISDIKHLKSKGILLDVLSNGLAGDNKILKQSTIGHAGKNLVLNPLDPTHKIIKKDYFLIKLKGPLLEAWKVKLIKEGVEIITYLGNNVYKIYARHGINNLHNQKFIISLRPFAINDTEVVVKKSILSDLDVFDIVSDKIALYDIKIRRNSSEKFLQFLEGVDVEIIDQSPQKVRVKLYGNNQLSDISQREEVDAIEEFIKPILHNDQARIVLNIDKEQDQNINTQTPYHGEGQLIGIADTGIDAAHPDFQGKIYKIIARGRTNDHSDPHGHGTHVAGSVLGSGNASDGKVKGIAPKARLFFQSILDAQGGLGGLPLDLHELFLEAYDEGVRIHNNSWGALAESEYLFNSLEVDEFVYHHKDMLIVISGGNEGSAHRPRNANPGFVDWLSLGSPATAKNALTVGASRSTREHGGFASLTHGQAWPDVYPDNPIKSETVSGDKECMAGFSSRGPCGNESRIKPDVVAPGTDIASTKSSIAPTTNFWGPYPKNRQYAFMGGTSMSAPIVTGFAALIREYYMKERQHLPSAALLKATIVNGTRVLKGNDALADHPYIPNFHQGFGCIDMVTTLPSPDQKDLKLSFIDSWKDPNLQFKVTGERFLFQLEVKEQLPLRICLTWIDPPGRGLQNNLNLFLMHKARQFKWTGNEQIPRTITTFDRDNNVEIIRIDDPVEGEYMIAVQAANLLFNPQDFALVVTGALNSQLTQL